MKPKPVVRASEVRLYTYCPRLYFFETHVKARRPLKASLRLILGRLQHLAHEVLARLRGYKVEELLEADMGGVRLRGKPDYYTVRGSTAVVVEFKSGRGPRVGAWLSDVMQVVSYAILLSRLKYTSVVGIVRYRRSTHTFKVTSEHVATLLRLVDEVALVKNHGLVPHPLRSYRKCLACTYKVECFTMDRGLNLDLEEPGSWLEGFMKSQSEVT
jgi:CRISPR-associated exonuclease Cas4